MDVWKRILTIFIVTISCVECDQGTKILASEIVTIKIVNILLLIAMSSMISRRNK